jgi:DNA-binding XRE family transcriptional regulator
VNTNPNSSPVAFFAAEMKRLRGMAGMTQEQLANDAGYASATVAAIETCRLLPSEDFARCVDKSLGAMGISSGCRAWWSRRRCCRGSVIWWKLSGRR